MVEHRRAATVLVGLAIRELVAPAVSLYYRRHVRSFNMHVGMFTFSEVGLCQDSAIVYHVYQVIRKFISSLITFDFIRSCTDKVRLNA